ncbi:MAG TPA: arginase [Burkholderiaceae bacterium]|nr:arginase [Burkholderiaceae bacterium]
MGHATQRIELIGAAIGEGAPDGRTRNGPGSLRRWGLGRRLTVRGRVVGWGPQVASDPDLRPRGPMAVVAEFSPRLAAAVGTALRAGRMPVVVGGDHSCAVGTWSAAAASLREADPEARLGLVWIDAHLDAHTPETSESQMPHGMALAALLGHGVPELTGVAGPAPKLRPEDVVLIGPRSWETGEAALLARLGVRVLTADEVVRRGFADCMREAVERVCERTTGWGVSFDLDALDPRDAPGTGVTVAEGLRLEEVTLALHGLGCRSRFVAAELVEYNPSLDTDRITAGAAERVLGALLDRRDRQAPASGPGLERRDAAARGRPSPADAT